MLSTSGTFVNVIINESKTMSRHINFSRFSINVITYGVQEMPIMSSRIIQFLIRVLSFQDEKNIRYILKLLSTLI